MYFKGLTKKKTTNIISIAYKWHYAGHREVSKFILLAPQLLASMSHMLRSADYIQDYIVGIKIWLRDSEDFPHQIGAALAACLFAPRGAVSGY